MRDKKVTAAKLQILCRGFETLSMKNGEFVQDYMSKVSAFVNFMKSYGEKISDELAVVVEVFNQQI